MHLPGRSQRVQPIPPQHLMQSAAAALSVESPRHAAGGCCSVPEQAADSTKTLASREPCAYDLLEYNRRELAMHEGSCC